VFVLYEDPAGDVHRALEAARARSRRWRRRAHEGVESLWAVPDVAAAGATMNGEEACGAEGVANIARVLAAQGVVLADGHHRYESALRHRDARRAAGAGAAGCDFMLACFVDVTDPGLLVLPTHRVIRGLPLTASASPNAPPGPRCDAAREGDGSESDAAAQGAFASTRRVRSARAAERALSGWIPAALRDAAPRCADAPGLARTRRRSSR
jgi:hypothetical protein